jgi:hypothetical protein
MEEWKLIEEFPNYEVSVLGKVRRKCNGRLLSVRPSVKYYYVVALRKDNRTLHRFVHTLVGRTFLPEYREGLFILHREEELPFPQINYLTNLFVGTKKDNNRDAIEKGRHVPYFLKVDCTGENNPSAVLSLKKLGRLTNK